MALMGVREYARHRGVSHVAVMKAVKAGRISNIDGKIDPVVADREWAQNTDTSRVKNSVTGDPHLKRDPEQAPAPMQEKADRLTPRATQAAPKGQAKEPAEQAPDTPQADVKASATYQQVRTARERYQALTAKLDYETRVGKLAPLDEIKVAWFQVVTLAKTKLLGVPSKSKSHIPSLSPRDVDIIDRLIREALEELVESECPLR